MSNIFTSKFVRLLQTFTKQEMNDFEAWLNSPWCNRNKNLAPLLKQIKRYHPNFDKNSQLGKAVLFETALPNRKFSERSINNLLSEAYLEGERFLAFQRFALNPGIQSDLLIQEFQGRYLDDWFYKASEGEIERIKAMPAPAREDHLSLFRQYHRTYHHPRLEPRVAADSAELTEMDRQLDIFYLLEKAAIINERMMRNRFFNDESNAVQAALEKWRLNSDGIDHPAISLYRMRFDGGQDFAAYCQLRDAFMAQLGMLSTEDCNTHLISLLNDTMPFVRSGHLDIADTFDLYRLGLEKGVLLPQGRLSVSTFTTVVSASNTKGSFEYTAYFLDQYAHCLEAKLREDALVWAKAHTHYWRKEMSSCLEGLRAYAFKTSHFQLTGRVLNTQAHFDSYLQDASYLSYLFSFLDAFERWLNREPLAESGKKAFLRFVQCCRALANIHAGTADDAPKLEKILQDEPNIQALNWLLRKKTEVMRLKNPRKAT